MSAERKIPLRDIPQERIQQVRRDEACDIHVTSMMVTDENGIVMDVQLRDKGIVSDGLQVAMMREAIIKLVTLITSRPAHRFKVDIFE